MGRLSIASELRTGYTDNPTLLVSVWQPKVRVSNIPLLFLPGAGGGADDVYGLLEFQEVVAAGFVGVCANLSELGQGWGNPTERAAIPKVLSWLATNYGTSSTQFAVIAGSMGGLTWLNWAPSVVARVVAAAMVIPAIDVEAIRQNDLDNLHIGLAASIETAWGGLAGFRAALPGANPARNPAAYRPLASITRIWATGNDNVCAFSDAQAFAAATGVSLVNPGNLGHLSPTGGLYWPEVTEWLLERLRPGKAGDLTVTGSVTVEGTVRSV